MNNKYGYNCPFNDNGACKYKLPRKDEFVCWICVDCCYIGCTNRECYCYMRMREMKNKYKSKIKGENMNIQEGE